MSGTIQFSQHIASYAIKQRKKIEDDMRISWDLYQKYGNSLRMESDLLSPSVRTTPMLALLMEDIKFEMIGPNAKSSQAFEQQVREYFGGGLHGDGQGDSREDATPEGG